MQVAVTFILFRALQFFDSITASRAAPDLPAMLEGLGPQKGLAKFFKQLAGITMLLSIVQLAEMLFPAVANSVFGASLGSVWRNVISMSLNVMNPAV